MTLYTDRKESRQYSLILHHNDENVQKICRYDTESFDSEPIPLITNVDNHLKIFHANAKVCFCSPACAKAFLFYNNNYTYDDLCLLNLYLSACLKIKNKIFQPAPPLEELKKFGGSLTLTAFRQNSQNHNLKKLDKSDAVIKNVVYEKHKEQRKSKFVFQQNEDDEETKKKDFDTLNSTLDKHSDGDKGLQNEENLEEQQESNKKIGLENLFLN